MIKLAPEGYPFILGSLFITVIVSIFLIWNWASGSYGLTFYFLFLTSFLFFGLAIFMAFFFRDPERKLPEGKGIFVSPADGKVIFTGEVFEKDYLKDNAKEISIFMSPFDVHVNRAPCSGVVESVVHTPGKFLSAFKPEASVQNDNIAMVLNTKNGKILVRQVAGFIARRAVCRVSEGDFLKMGDRYGMVKFGSRLDVYMPKDTKIKVKLYDKVKAGETVIGGIES